MWARTGTSWGDRGVNITDQQEEEEKKHVKIPSDPAGLK